MCDEVTNSLTRIECIILSVLYNSKKTNKINSLSINEVVQRTDGMLKRNTISANIKKLEKNNLINIGVMNGRSKTYYITEDGIKIVESWRNSK